MAYVAGNLFAYAGGSPGRILYRYDTEDEIQDVETAAYFNNLDDGLNLQIGDLIMVFEWDGTPHAAGQVLNNAIYCAVTHVMANDAPGNAGEINVATVFEGSSLVSSYN